VSKSALGPIGGALLLILVESPFLACTPGMNPEAASDGAVTADSGHGPLRPDRSDDTPQPGGSDGGALPHRGREVGEQGATVTFDGLVLEIPPGALARSEWIDCAPTAAPACDRRPQLRAKRRLHQHGGRFLVRLPARIRRRWEDVRARREMRPRDPQL